MTDDENPITKIRERAMTLFPGDEDADERNDYILGRMQSAGYKKGPGEWIKPEEDDTPQDDDDEPLTRGEWRQMRREQARKANASASTTPPKVTKEKTPLKEKNTNSGWWNK